MLLLLLVACWMDGVPMSLLDLKRTAADKVLNPVCFCCLFFVVDLSFIDSFDLLIYLFITSQNAISNELSNPKALIIVTYSTTEIDVIKNSAMIAATVILVSVFGVLAHARTRNQTERPREEGERLLTSQS
jgi:hypothetical protein